MTVIEAIRARLLALSGVTAQVSQRVYVMKLPQGGVLPAVRMQRIDEFESVHLRGAGALHHARIQIDSITEDSRTGAIALDEAIHGDGSGSGLSGWHGTVSTIAITGVLPIDVREGYDPIDLKQFKIMRDYEVFFRTA